MARGADRLSHSDEPTSRAHLLREEGGSVLPSHGEGRSASRLRHAGRGPADQIGRASCRERV